VFTYETANAKGEIERKLSESRPKSAKFWRFSGPDFHGLEKVSIFTAKGTSIHGTTSFKAFCVKIGCVMSEQNCLFAAVRAVVGLSHCR